MITAMSPIAWVYIRFSNKSQRDGDSEDRQMRKVLKFAAERGYATDPDRTLIDRGRSGYKGANLSRGELGKFVRDVETGKVRPGSVLIVEAIDRITRLPRREAEYVVDLLTDRRIKIACVYPAPGEVYDEDSNNDLLKKFGLMMRIELAHAEQKAKGERVSQAWQSVAKAAAKGERFGGRYPSWVTPDGAGWYVLNEHAATVRRAFELCIAGRGTDLIAGMLNVEGYPTFPAIGERRRAAAWGGTHVRLLLGRVATFGAWQPMEVKGKVVRGTEKTLDGVVTKWRTGDERTARGSIILDRYPAAISRETFDLAQEAIKTRFEANRGRKPGQVVDGEAVPRKDATPRRKRIVRDLRNGPARVMANVLSGRVFCAACGGRLQRQQDRRDFRFDTLYCPGYRDGRCDAKGHVRAEPISLAVLRRAKAAFEIVSNRREPARDATYDLIRSLEDERDAAQTDMDAWRKRHRGQAVSDALSRQFERMASEIAEFEDKIAEARRTLQTLDLKASDAPPAYDALIGDLAEAGEKRDNAIALLNQALRLVIQRIEITVGGPARETWTMDTINAWASTTSDRDDWYVRPVLTYTGDDPEDAALIAGVMKDLGPGREVGARIRSRTEAPAGTPSGTRPAPRSRRSRAA